MRFGSVCSGIEAASVAWHPLGWKAAWLSEIEPFPSAVLKHHYPDVPNLGDMTLLPERILSGEVEAPDVFCGGTPCQAFSVAGLRNSLDDARGNLSLTFVGIANAIDHVRSVRRDDPAIIFWENVPGVLSTKDNAFGCFLGALAGEDDPILPPGEKWTNAGCVYGPQRTVAWRVLDAQYFGVAQRRRRVFVVASARDDFDPAAVLFEFDGVRRDTAPSREAGQSIAPCVTNGPPFSGTGNERVEAEAMVVQPYEVGNCLTARMHKGINSTLDEGQTPVISIHPHCIGRAPEAGPQGKEYLLDGSEYCMDSRGQPQAVVQPIDFRNLRFHEGNVAGTMQSKSSGGYSLNYETGVMQPIPINSMNAFRSPDADPTTGCGIGEAGEAMFTITKTNSHAVAQPMVLMDQGGSVMNVEHDMVGTLRRESHGHEPVVMQPISFGAQMSVPQVDFDLNQTLQAKNPMAVAQPIVAMRESGLGYWMEDTVAGTLDANMGMSGHANRPAVMTVPQAMVVRRLTPVECERLQGFPDGYTNIPWRKKDESPDGPRYKALGNSWAVPNVRWIGKRIQEQINAP